MENKYDFVTRIFHWLVALCIICLFSLGISFSLVNRDDFMILMPIHKSLALTTLILMILRVIWRLSMSYTPVYPTSMVRWQIVLGHSVHFMLYGLFFVMVCSGWLMSSWGGSPVMFWGLFNVALPLTKNTYLSGIANGIHGFCAWTLGILVLGHIAVACFHQFIKRDGILQRMI